MQPDDTYSWTIVKQERGIGFNAIFINMTSQAWLTAADVDRHVWWHSACGGFRSRG